MDNMKVIIGKRLREFRKRAKMTQAEAAKKIGIHYTTLGKYELGEREPDFITIQKLSELYGVKIEEIVGSIGRPNRLEELRLKYNQPVQVLADLLNISSDDYLILEKIGQELDLPEAKLLARHYNVTIDYLMGYGPRSSEKQVPYLVNESIFPYNPEIMLRLPVLGSIRAGEPIDRIEYNEGYTLVEPDLLRGHEGFALRVKGDSMSGDRIMDGDIVIVQKTPEVQPHEIAVVAVDGDEATLKRVKRHGDMVMLVSSNPEYEPMLVPAKDVFIIGKVVEVKFRPK